MSGLERIAILVMLLAGFGVAVSAYHRQPLPELAISTTAPGPAGALATDDCRAINRELAAHITRQTRALIARDHELRRLRADLAAARERAGGLSL